MDLPYPTPAAWHNIFGWIPSPHRAHAAIDISWFNGPPTLKSILGENHLLLEPGFGYEVMEVQRLNVDSTGMLPLNIEVWRNEFQYYGVLVVVKNAARRPKWKPLLDYYRHFLGGSEFVRLQRDYMSRLAAEIEEALDKREGRGISINEVELIASSIYQFVSGMGRLVHTIKGRLQKPPEVGGGTTSVDEPTRKPDAAKFQDNHSQAISAKRKDSSRGGEHSNGRHGSWTDTTSRRCVQLEIEMSQSSPGMVDMMDLVNL